MTCNCRKTPILEIGSSSVFGGLIRESPNQALKWGLKATLCNSCTIVCNCALVWPFGPFCKGNFRRKARTLAGKYEQLRTSCPKPPFESPHLHSPDSCSVRSCRSCNFLSSKAKGPPDISPKCFSPKRAKMVRCSFHKSYSGRPRFGSVRLRFGGGTVRAVPVFGSGGSSAKRVFLCVQYSLTGKDGSGSGFGSWKRFRRFRFRFRFREKRFRRFCFPVPVRFLSHPGYCEICARNRPLSETKFLDDFWGPFLSQPLCFTADVRSPTRNPRLANPV